MKKYPIIQSAHKDTKWSNWIMPIMKGYRMACCDCNLVHELQFKVIKAVGKETKIAQGVVEGDYKNEKSKKYRIALKAKRHNRATGQLRRRKKPKNEV